MKTGKGAVVVLGLLSMYQSNADLAKVGAFVVDDKTGAPLRNVPVVGYFSIKVNGWLAFKGGEPPNRDSAVTDVNGRCRLRGRTNCGDVGCWVEKPPFGYYAPRRGWGWTFQRKNLLGIWQPDNLVATIRLQRVERPIPLFIKRVTKAERGGFTADIFPKGEDTLRYDLLMGDWLAPVGTGRVADVTFTRHPREDLGEGVNGADVRGPSYRDSMTVRFPGEGNGIVELHPPPSLRLRIRTAPEDGYRPEYLCWKGRDKTLEHVGSYDENRCFCFRIRTRRDDRGRIVGAYYGKIYGDITFVYQFRPEFVPVASVCMSYYLNPTPLDRNLEWDRKTNLGPDRVDYDLLP